jgi:hypothetical protein
VAPHVFVSCCFRIKNAGSLWLPQPAGPMRPLNTAGAELLAPLQPRPLAGRPAQSIYDETGVVRHPPFG